MVLGSFFKKFSIILLLISLVAMSFGCSSKVSDFPEIPAPTISSSMDSTVEEVPSYSDENYKLTLALPYSDSTINYLFKYFYAKQNGLLSTDDNGANISLDLLDSINVPYAIETIYVPDTGTSAESIEAMGEDKPDIFLTYEMDVCIDRNLVAPINDYCSVNPLFNSDSVYVSSVLACVKNENLYGIPHYMSIPLIYANLDFLPDDYTNNYKISLNDFNQLLDSVYEINGEDVVCLASARNLIPYLGSAFDNKDSEIRSYLLIDEFSNNPEEAELLFDDICEYIGDLYADGFSKDYNDDGSVPTYSRNAALWVSSSSDIMKFSAYYPNKLVFMQVPVFMDSEESVPFVTVYPICVSSSSLSVGLMSEFASFISLDPDALLLINRLESKTGMLPVIDNDTVWDAIISDENFGYIASLYENLMYYSICSQEVINSSLTNKINNIVFDSFDDDSDNSFDLVDIYE